MYPTEVTNLGMQRGVITCDCVRERFERGGRSGRDQPVFGEMTAQSVDHLRALADKHLPRAKQHGAGLLILRLHGDKAHC